MAVRWRPPGALVLMWLATACGSGSEARDARELVLRSQAATGSLDGVEGPVSVFAVGTLNKTAEGQGYAPSSASVGPYEERLSFSPDDGSALWQYHETRYDGTTESFGESYVGDLHRLFVVDVGITVPIRVPDSVEAARRIARRFPHVLLAEVLATAVPIEIAESRQSSTLVSGGLSNGGSVVLEFDNGTDLLLEATYEAVLPGQGRTAVTWWFGEYVTWGPNLRYPTRFGSRVGGVPYTDMSVDSVVVTSPTVFEGPPDLRQLPIRPSGEGDELPPLELRSLADGVFTVPDVRSGFAPLVIEFAEHLMVVDAPASFPLLGQVPPGETDPSPSMSWHAESLIDFLEARWPEKPVSQVVLTHHHEDHVGGVRAFVSAGAMIIGSPESLEVAGRLVGLAPGEVSDRFSEDPAELRTEILTGARSFTDGTMTVDLLPLDPNPHASGMYVVSIPSSAALYVSDMVTPGPLEEYPRSNHRVLDRSFARWLARSGLDVQVVWTMHGSGVATADHLEMLVDGTPGNDI